MRIAGSGRVPETTHPVARIRSITPSILRLCALCSGSDKPTPRGLGDDIFDCSGVVVKEEIVDDLLLWELEGIGSLGFQPGSFYGCPYKYRSPKGSVAVYR